MLLSLLDFYFPFDSWKRALFTIVVIVVIVGRRLGVFIGTAVCCHLLHVGACSIGRVGSDQMLVGRAGSIGRVETR